MIFVSNFRRIENKHCSRAVWPETNFKHRCYTRMLLREGKREESVHRRYEVARIQRGPVCGITRRSAKENNNSPAVSGSRNIIPESIPIGRKRHCRMQQRRSRCTRRNGVALRHVAERNTLIMRAVTAAGELCMYGIGRRKTKPLSYPIFSFRTIDENAKKITQTSSRPEISEMPRPDVFTWRYPSWTCLTELIQMHSRVYFPYKPHRVLRKVVNKILKRIF